MLVRLRCENFFGEMVVKRGLVVVGLWAGLVATAGCGNEVTSRPDLTWLSARQWMSLHARPRKAVEADIGVLARKTAPHFYGISVFNTYASVVMTVHGRHITIPSGSTIHVTVSPKPHHPVLSVTYQLPQSHVWHTVFRRKSAS